MVLRIGIALVLGSIAVIVAVVADRRMKATSRGAAPVTTSREAPIQILRSDFARPDAPWLVVVFSSTACAGCAAMAKKVAVLESPDVATCDVEFSEQRELHDRYAIHSVPLVIVADAAGVVRRSFFGSTSATDLWAALAELRDVPMAQH